MKVTNKIKTYSDFAKDYKPVKEFFSNINIDLLNTSDITEEEGVSNICDTCGCTGVNCTCNCDDTISQEIGKIENEVADEVADDVEKAITINFNTASSQSDFMPKIFSIVKLMTQNGEKVAMCYSEDVSNYGTPIHQNLDFKTACDMVKNHCSETGCDEFKNESDNIIGQIPSFMIQKKTDSNTSYKK